VGEEKERQVLRRLKRGRACGEGKVFFGLSTPATPCSEGFKGTRGENHEPAGGPVRDRVMAKGERKSGRRHKERTYGAESLEKKEKQRAITAKKKVG